VRALLFGLGDAEAAVATRFEARGHAVTARAAGALIGPGWLEEAYDVVVDHWPRAVRSGFASWAASACGGAFILTVVDGEPDTEIVAALLASGTDDVIARTAFERHLDERILVIEHTLFRWASRKKAEAVTIRDVTERPEAEERLRDLAENLSATLDGDNPLACVISTLDVSIEKIRALSDRLTAAERDELEAILREVRSGAERLRQIVRGLETFSRSEDEPREVLELRPILELAARMAANAIRHRARLVENFGAVPLVEGDGARLRQVFINVLISAAQGLPDSQSETNEVRIATSTDEAGRAVIEIEDTGPGARSPILGRAFDSFYVTSLVGLGTGLGLTVSQNILNRMGAEVAVQREEGHGTTVRVVFPPAAVQEVAEVVDRAHPAFAEVSEILVIDDEGALGTALRRVLARHDVTVVKRAPEALELLAAGRTFDVIFCDLVMPEVSGMDFYDEASRGFPDAAERTVFVTEGAFRPIAAAFLAGLANKQLEKPFAPETVRTLVHALGRARRGPSMSETVELRPKPEFDRAVGEDRDGREPRPERGDRTGRN
jgi:signal transduction histidine kinase